MWTVSVSCQSSHRESSEEAPCLEWFLGEFAMG
ncbi:Uncharacterised protein [Vibrio cholerae]|nr:Uncharacterised protein [Vibrio cholerae]